MTDCEHLRLGFLYLEKEAIFDIADQELREKALAEIEERINRCITSSEP